MWTIANAVADDPECQKVFLTKHEHLLATCFDLVDVGSEKINLELSYMIDNIIRNRIAR